MKRILTEPQLGHMKVTTQILEHLSKGGFVVEEI